MEPQEILDTVARHLFEQGEQSINATGVCQYRDAKGNKCAVGCLIPDEMYSTKMEGHGLFNLVGEMSDHKYELPEFIVRDVKDKYGENLRGGDDMNATFLEELQGAHDTAWIWMSTQSMRRALKDVALLFKLDDSIVDTLSFKDR